MTQTSGSFPQLSDNTDRKIGGTKPMAKKMTPKAKPASKSGYGKKGC